MTVAIIAGQNDDALMASLREFTKCTCPELQEVAGERSSGAELLTVMATGPERKVPDGSALISKLHFPLLPSHKLSVCTPCGTLFIVGMYNDL